MVMPAEPGARPRVAVIIAAFNAADTIERAIQSALAEPDVSEVVVVDDASPDETVAAAKRADDGTGRVKILRTALNAGPAAARNRGIEESASDWITILDSDDYFLPGRIAAMLEFESEADIIADDLWQVREGLPFETATTLMNNAVQSPRPITFAQFVDANISRGKRQRGELGFVKPLIRRRFLEAHAIRYRSEMRLGEDYELYARALAMGARFLLVPPKGYVSIWRSNSLSGRHTPDDLFHLRESDDALMRISGLDRKDLRALRDHYLSIDGRLQWRLALLAFKRKDVVAIGATLCRPWPVPLYVAGQIVEAIVSKTLSALGIGRRLDA